MVLLVLSLSVMPCADAGAAIKDTKAKTAINKKSDQQDHDDNDARSTFRFAVQVSPSIIL